MSTIAILGTMDTKGVEHGFVADLIRQRGHNVLIIDVGTLGEARLKPDITRNEVAAAAGADLATLMEKRDRGDAVTAMSLGAPVILARLAAEKRIDGVISLVMELVPAVSGSGAFASSGDLDGDGYRELVFGTPGLDAKVGGYASGRVYAFSSQDW